MKFYQCLKSALRRQVRVVIVIGITSCCIIMMVIPTLFSTMSLSASHQNIIFMPAHRQQKWNNEQLEFDVNEKIVKIKRNFFMNGNILYGDKKSAMGLDFTAPTRDSFLDVNLIDHRMNLDNNNSSVLTVNNDNFVKMNDVQDIVTEKQMKKTLKRRMFHRTYSRYAPMWKTGLYYNHSVAPLRFNWWTTKQQRFCGKRFLVYANEFALLQGVFIDRNYCPCSLKGGEYIASVLNQSEKDEYYTFRPGCFQMTCSAWPTTYYFNNDNNHLNLWINGMSTSYVHDNVDHVRADFTIAITRYEYANLYHTMTDWYNAFLLMQYFNHTSHTTNILIIDSHPYGQLDSVWPRLFNSTVRLSALPSRTYFLKLVWGMLGYNSPMKTHPSRTPPLYEEFREFFLGGYGIEPNNHTFDCEHMSILFIWRRDYLAHPRNPSGFVSRKIANEAQLLRYIQKHHPTFHVHGMQIDQYDMRIQLKHIVSTDILIGMHGAGLTHAAFLPQRAGLIELAPSYTTSSGEHFMAIARWRRLVYEMWQNDDVEMERENEATIVPPYVLNKIIKRVVQRLCVPEVETSVGGYFISCFGLRLVVDNEYEDYDLPTVGTVIQPQPLLPTTTLSASTSSKKRWRQNNSLSLNASASKVDDRHFVLTSDATSQNVSLKRRRNRRLNMTSITVLPEPVKKRRKIVKKEW